MYDIAIIGTGIIGTTIARELSRYSLKVIMLDKAGDIASGTTKANSAIVHAGYDAEFGTNKAYYNVRGNALYPTLCSELAVPFKQIGSYVCAQTKQEVGHLKKLLENGRRLGISGLEIIDGKELLNREPNVNPSVLAALYAPTAGITEPWELAIACAENAIQNGVTLKLDFEVQSIKSCESSFYLSNEKEFIRSRCVINCAGVYSDEIASMVMADPDFNITPRRGQYYLLDKSVQGLVKSIIFPAPSIHGKGVLIAPTVDGNIIVGPNAEDLPEEFRESRETTNEGLAEVRDMAKLLIKEIPFDKTITVFSGLRAEADKGDFIIEESSIDGFINVAGIKSPGLSAAPAIAQDVTQLALNFLEDVQKNPDFSPFRRPRPKLEKMSPQERADLIHLDPRFGNIVCRCEMISEGEIVDAIHRKAGATTVNGIKRRVRPGAGRCQGGFCGPRVMEILARELGTHMEQVIMEEKGSLILMGSTRP
jgi:glycerol-3-phosphate dehydrogenase